MVDFTCSSKHHAFPLFRESERRQRFLQFANILITNKVFNVDDQLVGFGLKILNDCLRVEFPTNTFRDMLTPYQNSNFPCVIPEVQRKLADKKVYTLVLMLISLEFEKELLCFNSKIRAVAENFENGFYDSHLTKMVRVDCLRDPLRGLPYCRTTVSGKFLPRLFAGQSGVVYDLFGMAVSNCSYDKKTCSLSFSQYNFQVPVPHIQLSVDLQTFLLKNLHYKPFLSWMYTTTPSSIKLPDEVEKAFRKYWRISSTENVFEEHSTLPTYVRFFSDSMATLIGKKYSKVNVFVRRRDGAVRLMLTPVGTDSSVIRNLEIACPKKI